MSSEVRPQKLLFLDCETTGLDPLVNGVIQISGVIEVGGIAKDAFDFRIKPFDTDVIDPKALETNGKTVEDLKGFKSPQIAHRALLTVLGKHVDKYDKHDKFLLVAYNAQFDQKMMKAWFDKLGDPYYFSWVTPQCVDVYSLAAFFRAFGKIDTPNLKQVTVADHFGMTYDAHDAYADVKVCRQIFHKFAGFLSPA